MWKEQSLGPDLAATRSVTVSPPCLQAVAARTEGQPYRPPRESLRNGPSVIVGVGGCPNSADSAVDTAWRASLDCGRLLHTWRKTPSGALSGKLHLPIWRAEQGKVETMRSNPKQEERDGACT